MLVMYTPLGILSSQGEGQFTRCRWKRLDGERFSLEHFYQCSRLGASAQVSGQKRLTFRVIYQLPLKMKEQTSMVRLTTRALLEQLGLTITTPESDSRGYGYIRRGRPWVGPHRSEYQALQVAFGKAIEIMNTERPNSQSNYGAWWVWNNGWQYLGKLEHEKES
jgi:hypothetical protein